MKILPRAAKKSACRFMYWLRDGMEILIGVVSFFSGFGALMLVENAHGAGASKEKTLLQEKVDITLRQIKLAARDPAGARQIETY